MFFLLRHSTFLSHRFVSFSPLSSPILVFTSVLKQGQWVQTYSNFVGANGTKRAHSWMRKNYFLQNIKCKTWNFKSAVVAYHVCGRDARHWASPNRSPLTDRVVVVRWGGVRGGGVEGGSENCQGYVIVTLLFRNLTIGNFLNHSIGAWGLIQLQSSLIGILLCARWALPPSSNTWKEATVLIHFQNLSNFGNYISILILFTFDI